MLDLCVFAKNHSNKRTLASKKSPGALRTNNFFLSESYHTRPPAPPSLAVQLQLHLSKIENGLTCEYIFSFYMWSNVLKIAS